MLKRVDTTAGYSNVLSRCSRHPRDQRARAGVHRTCRLSLLRLSTLFQASRCHFDKGPDAFAFFGNRLVLV